MSCAEIRHLFWEVVLAGPRDVARLLEWSGWRRWHQRWAQWHHTRRRDRQLPPRTRTSAMEVSAPSRAEVDDPTPAPVDVIGLVWSRLAPLLPTKRRSGYPLVYDRRVILDAIVYVLQTDCGWKELPSTFPPWKTVHEQYVVWRESGIWNQIWAGLTPPARPSGT